MPRNRVTAAAPVPLIDHVDQLADFAEDVADRSAKSE
jgi:hypothetical protein